MDRMVRVGAVRTPAETVDVVILTVIPAELDAARRVLQIDDLDREKDTDGTVYFRVLPAGVLRATGESADARVQVDVEPRIPA